MLFNEWFWKLAPERTHFSALSRLLMYTHCSLILQDWVHPNSFSFHSVVL